jgi:hypothetical protein
MNQNFPSMDSFNTFLTINSCKTWFNTLKLLALSLNLMKTVVRHIVTYFSALLIVAATGGISLIEHYCGCQNEQRSSLFTESVQCHLEDNESCCADKTYQTTDLCCSKDTGSEEKSQHHHSDHDCCSTVYSYYKTDQVNLKKPVTAPGKFFHSYVVLLVDSRMDQESSGSVFGFRDAHPPPTAYGKDLLNLLHQRKLEAPPC